ncbi:MAG: ABC transporter ATP-binding protein [Castellaniella sp.]
MNPVRIELQGVTKRYGDSVAVQQVDLRLHAGECVALAGHNGAGKSTLIKLMLGLIHSDGGTVRVLGDDPRSGRAPARLHVGYLPETVALHPAMTGLETLAFYARLKRQPVAGNLALLERVGIARAATKRVSTYSKGMRQRLALAQALLGSPRVLLLDEPTTGLDPALRQNFYEIVNELRAAGATLLLSSHALAEIEGQADRIVVMKNGCKVADGTLEELRRDARLPLVLRLRLADETPEGAVTLPAVWQRLEARRYEWRLPMAEKMNALRSLAALPAEVQDIQLVQPGLDEMYAHFLRREET